MTSDKSPSQVRSAVLALSLALATPAVAATLGGAGALRRALS